MVRDVAMTNDEYEGEEVEAITVEAIEVEPELEPDSEDIVEDVLDEPPPPTPPKPKPRKKEKEPKKRSKMKVIIVVVVLVVAVVALAMLFMIEPTVNGINVHAVDHKDALKIIVDLHGRGQKTEIHGHGLLQGQKSERQFINVNFHAIDRIILLNDMIRHIRIPIL